MTIHDQRRLGGSPSPRRLRRAAGAVCAAVALTSLAGAAQAAEPGIPTDIQVPAGHKMYLEAHAKGEQIYECVAIGDGYGWGPSTPRADLYGDNGKLLGKHYGGPTWEAKDGSKVVARRDAPPVTKDPTAIPWLRLAATSVSAGPDGDRFAGTTYIQRVATTGGLAPDAADCTAATAGTKQAIDYTADYRFWKADDALSTEIR
jgi:hypothetical protein